MKHGMKRQRVFLFAVLVMLFSLLVTGCEAPTGYNPDASVGGVIVHDEPQPALESVLVSKPPEESPSEKTETPHLQNPAAPDKSTNSPVPESGNGTEPFLTIDPSNTPSDSVPPPKDSSFAVHFIDVGQADASLILCDGKSMLIDAGNAADSNLIYAYLKKQSLNHLDYIVCTHAHEDHVGGLSGALNYATVDVALAPVTSYDSKAFRNFTSYLAKQNVAITVPSVGDTFALGSASVNILGPVTSTSDTNNTSIVLRVVYGDTSFLFTGDAEREEEQDILNAGYTLNSTVLKVGHHGSDTSTSYVWLREIMPKYAVISVGKDNSYGHPTEEVLSRLRDSDTKTYRTDMQGDVICVSDGKAVSFTVGRNADADTLADAGNGGHSGSSDNCAPPVQPQSGASTPPAQSTTPSPEPTNPTSVEADYILNTNTHKFHYPTCGSVKQISEKNKWPYHGNRADIISMGYVACKKCHP